MNSPGNPSREKYINTHPNTQDYSRYLLRYPNSPNTDTNEHSRYLTNHPYTKNHTWEKLNVEKFLPHSSDHSYTRRYNDEESVISLSHSSRYRGRDINRRTSALELDKHSKLETHSSLYPHTERYAPTEVNAIDDMYSSHFSHLMRNECSRLETFEDSVISSQKYELTVDDLELSPLYSHREQYVPRELGTDRDYTYLSHDLHKRTKMNTENQKDDFCDPSYLLFRQKEKLTGMEVVEDPASFRLHYTRNFMPYVAKNSVFVSPSHRDRRMPMELDNDANELLYLHTELNNSPILDAQLYHDPSSGRYMSIDQDAIILSTHNKSNTNNTLASSSERRHGMEFDDTDNEACPPRSKKKFHCEFCPKKFYKRYPLHMHMVDKHNVNDGKYIPSINPTVVSAKREKPKIIWKELLQMKRKAKSELKEMKRKAKLMPKKPEAILCEPDPLSSKRKKCELCNKSVRAMHRHMHGVHNPMLKFKCDICHKTFRDEYLFKLHKKGKGTNKCLPKAMRANRVTEKLVMVNHDS